MIVYGDHNIDIPLRDFVAGFRRRWSSTVAGLDEARVRLVLAGQLEQAAADAQLTCVEHCRALTRSAAEVFHKLTQRLPAGPEAWGNMLRALQIIQRQACASNEVLHVRTPEGFAFYGLYPDAYTEAALRWASDAAPRARVVAIGVRSIGTTLVAVVAAALRSRGLAVCDLTVRPDGHPFHRRACLPPNLPSAEHVLIIDEGPGLSGSSMAAVAHALVERGFGRHSITFFPGHLHGPGQEGSADVHRCWAETRQCSVPWPDLRLGGESASEVLSNLARSHLAEPLSGDLRDFSGGRWRDACEDTLGADAIAPCLEHPKLLARGASGRSLLFKFAGFSLAGVSGRLASTSERQSDKLADLAHAGWAVAPVAEVHGWLALPWLIGIRLKTKDLDRPLLQHLGRYIAASAGPPLDASAAQAACGRLRRMLITNTRELLGADRASQAERISDALDGPDSEAPSYGDGRLAPHEWIRVEGRVLKFDAGGHDQDHTTIGPQPIWWDVAGASVEWKLEAEAMGELAHIAGVRDGPSLGYYRAAYAAFRAATADLCARSSTDAYSRQRLEAARARYTSRLQRELEHALRNRLPLQWR